jgi:hypothetical protein
MILNPTSIARDKSSLYGNICVERRCPIFERARDHHSPAERMIRDFLPCFHAEPARKTPSAPAHAFRSGKVVLSSA